MRTASEKHFADAQGYKAENNFMLCAAGLIKRLFIFLI
jgi:hypothetical protein